jgi:hypothetical protein
VVRQECCARCLGAHKWIMLVCLQSPRVEDRERGEGIPSWRLLTCFRRVFQPTCTQPTESDSLSHISLANPNPGTTTACGGHTTVSRLSTFDIILLALESTAQPYHTQRRLPSSPSPTETRATNSHLAVRACLLHLSFPLQDSSVWS